MPDHRSALPTRRELLEDRGILVVYRDPQRSPQPAPGQPGTRSEFVPTEPELFLAMLADGRVIGFNGHVDLGTGIRTALAQIVTEELDVAFDSVRMVLGDPRDVPNQGPTIASASIQITAVPLRKAAAQARRFLLERAAQRFGAEADTLNVADGVVSVAGESQRALSYAQLLENERFELRLDPSAEVKSPAEYRIVGQSAARVDIPAKATGQLTFVHDMRVPGMLHGRVVRPPYVGRDSGEFVGKSLLRVHRDSIDDIAGIVAIVVEKDFIGIVAEREEQAARAARQLRVDWSPIPELPDMVELEATLRANPATQRPLKQTGDIETALQQATVTLERSYIWPYNLHASIGPSCALADMREGKLKIWSGTQNPHSLRADLARLLNIDEGNIEIVRMEASGCYGRNCADDVCADAALLTRAVGRPVRVQLTREQEHGWEPKGAAQLMDISGALGPDSLGSAYRFRTRYPSNDAPTLALLLTGKIEAASRVFEMGDRTAVPPYEYANLDITCDDTAPIVRAAWLRGVSALPNTFAHECFVDELAYAATADPIEFRLRHLSDARVRSLIETVAERAGWLPRTAASNFARGADGLLRGRGFAYAHYVHSRFPGFGAAMAAWAIELAVDPTTGAIHIERLVVGQDAGLMVNPAGVRHQVHGNVIQSLSRSLKEEVRFDDQRAISLEWGSYPIVDFTEIPDIELVLINRPDEPPLGVGETASLPAAPAIANALFDATGVRFYRAPFTPKRVRERLNTPTNAKQI